jgi:hypothetical protein
MTGGRSGQRGVDASDDHDRPYLQRLIARGSSRFERSSRSGLQALGRTTLLWLWAAVSIAVFAIVLVRALFQANGIGDVLTAVLGAAFAGLLVAGAGAWLLMWAIVPAQPAPVDRAAEDALTALLTPTLRELDAVRAEIVRQVRKRSVLFVPAGAIAGLALWTLGRVTDDPPVLFDLLLYIGAGALGGEVWAAHNLSKEYARLYKNRVLPLLARRFGNLTYREATAADLGALAGHRVLRDFDSCTAEDEIAGTHRGLPLRITAVTLKKSSGDEYRTVFDGLLIELVLPRSLTSTTAVIADEGLVGNLGTRLRPSTLPRVRLEDPRFEAHFEVYGSDQIEARALLTPAFMERLTRLAEGTGFALPGALAEGNRLTMALPARTAGKLFEPPPYWKPAGGQVLVRLSREIEAVLKMADTVIDLDFWAAGARTPQAG